MKIHMILATIALAIVSGCTSPTQTGPCPPCGKRNNVAKTADTAQAGKMISLGDSLAPLRSRFNADKDKVRLVALLSPT